MKTADIKPGIAYAVATFNDYDGYALRGTVMSAGGREVTVLVRVFDDIVGGDITERRTVRPKDIRETWDDYTARIA